MPATLSELFNGGIVTARHPALLKEGELQRADDCVYREKDPAIWRAPGRQKVNATALGSVWAGSAAGVKGLLHLSFERQRTDQLIAYSGTVLARASLSASAAPTLDAIDLALSCTTVSTTIVTTASTALLQVGWRIKGTNIPVGTRIFTIDSSTQFTMTAAATSSTTLTLTFNPMMEMGGPSNVAGTVASNVFTATTGFPFLAEIVGAQALQLTARNVYVTAVSGQSGTTGHYSTVTLSTGLPDASYTIFFPQGTVQTFSNTANDRNEILDTAQYGGIYFVWNGKDPMQRLEWRPAGTAVGTLDLEDVLNMRPAALLPVIEQPLVTQAASGTYTWPATLAPGYYWFLVTEIWDPDNTPDGKSSPNEIESAYYGKNASTKLRGEPVPINIPALTGFGATIQFPRQINTGADGRYSTHWGVYMYGPTGDDKTFPSLAAFRRVSKIRITASDGTQTTTLTEISEKQTKFATAAASVAGFNQFSNPTNMADGEAGYSDGDFASASSGSNNDSNHTPAANNLGTFGFSTGLPFSGYTVFGVRITIRGSADPGGNAGNIAGYGVQLRAGASKTTDLIWGDFGAQTAHVNYHGGEMDKWGIAWVPSDFADGTFTVFIMKSFSGSGQELRINGVKVEVFYQSGSINLNGKPFRVVSYRDQIGTTVNEPAYGPPPICNTGDLYQGSLVVNDLKDETAIRFTLAGEPEAWPGPYVMRFNTTRRKDRVTVVRTLGQVLLVGMENGIKRVNYLPTEADTDFHEGLAHDDLTTDHGIPGPLAAVKFDWPGRGTIMAYASIAGVFVTDGITTRPVNMDLDWPNTVKLSALSSCVFRVYPKEKWLVLYYCPAGATHNRNTKALVFSYAADKIKQGDELPCTGPLTVSGRSSVEIITAGNHYLFTGHETNGFIYQEDFSTAQASGYQVHNASDTLADAPIIPFIRTRRIYPAGFTHDCHLYKAYLLFSAYGSTITATGTTTAGSTTVTSAAAFGSVVAGMRIKGTGIDEGTIVLTASASSLTLSRAANAAGTVTLSFDTGTVGVSDRGNGIGEAVATMHTVWGSTLTGDMIVVHLDDMRQGLEIQIEKVPLTFTTDADGLRYDTATWADLSVNMRLHQLAILFDDQGPEQTRSTS